MRPPATTARDGRWSASRYRRSPRARSRSTTPRTASSGPVRAGPTPAISDAVVAAARAYRQWTSASPAATILLRVRQIDRADQIFDLLSVRPKLLSQLVEIGIGG